MNRLWSLLPSLAILAPLLTGCGDSQGETGFVDLALAIVHGDDQVRADELSDWLVARRKDFVLIDVRPQRDFAKGHIQSAENLPLTWLVEPRTLAGLPRDRKLVLYSNGDRKAAQAVVMLRQAGLQAYTLVGGYRFWVRHVLHPELPAGAGDDEILKFRKRQAAACFFSGNYKGGIPAAPPAKGFTPKVHRRPPGKKKAGVKIEEGC